MEVNLEQFKKHSDWVKVWSAKGSLIFDSHLGDQWTKIRDVFGSPAIAKVIIFYKNGVSDCWVSNSDRIDLGFRLSAVVKKDDGYVEKISDRLIAHTDKISEFIKSHAVKDFKLVEFDEFWNLVQDYFLYHISVKYIVEGFSDEELNKYLPILERARLYCEPAYRNIENYIEFIAERVAAEISYTKEMILSLTKEEFRSYFQDNLLPDKFKLENRYGKSAIVFDDKGREIFIGNKVDEVEIIISSLNITDSIKGQIAYKGKVDGKVKIIFNPSEDDEKFNKGDILVTGMTRPEFLPLMERAGGFITDAGGILSHAAITAREMKKPCIIGTQIATKVLKDGDEVEVDADKGIVKIIKRA